MVPKRNHIFLYSSDQMVAGALFSPEDLDPSKCDIDLSHMYFDAAKGIIGQ